MSGEPFGPTNAHRPLHVSGRFSRPILWAGLFIYWTALGAVLCSAGPQAGSLSPEEIEEFLRTAGIVQTVEIAEGVTNSLRATLSNGRFIHDAQIQAVDESKSSHPGPGAAPLNLRDSYKFNIAAYRLSRLLGLNMVPVSVEREVDGRPAAVTWWVDDLLMTEKTRYLQQIRPPSSNRWNHQMHLVRVFDALIFNVDRNLGNLLITKDWKLWMIDHTQAFRDQTRIRDPQNLVRCDRMLLQALRKLKKADLLRVLSPYLHEGQIRALLRRRDLIVEHFQQKVVKEGEKAVLYDFLPD